MLRARILQGVFRLPAGRDILARCPLSRGECRSVTPNVDNAGMWLAVVIAESQGSCESGMREGW